MIEDLLTIKFYLCAKMRCIFLRLFDVVRFLPKRLLRLGIHFIKGYRCASDTSKPRSFHCFYLWCAELACYVADIFGFPEIYETIMDIVKFTSRPLRKDEIARAKKLFGNNLLYYRVRVDEHGFVAARMLKTTYLAFNVIHNWGKVDEPLLMHELTHAWQFHKYGSSYIPKALSAQTSVDGYDYGGIPNLLIAIRSGQGFDYFNFEQQGEIVSDYCALVSGQKPRWSHASSSDLWVFEHLIGEMGKTSSILPARKAA